MTYPTKVTPLDAPVLNVIEKRWSPLSFDPAPLKDGEIRSLFEAVRWAQSSYGEQPWRYIYAEKNDPGRDALEKLLAEGNSWAKDAGLLMINFCKKNFTHNGKPNRHYMHDVGAASAILTLQATSMGLVTHQMAGFDVAGANAALGVPDDYEPGSMMAVGQYAGTAALPAPLKQREATPRTRMPQELFAMRGKWQA